VWDMGVIMALTTRHNYLLGKIDLFRLRRIAVVKLWVSLFVLDGTFLRF